MQLTKARPRRFRSSVAARPLGRFGLPLGEDPKTVVTGTGEWAGQVTGHTARRRFPSAVAVVVVCGVCPVEVTGDRRPQQGPATAMIAASSLAMRLGHHMPTLYDRRYRNRVHKRSVHDHTVGPASGANLPHASVACVQAAGRFWPPRDAQRRHPLRTSEWYLGRSATKWAGSGCA